MYILEFHFRILCLLLFQNLGVQTVYSPEKEAEIRNEEIKIASYDMISRPKAQTVVKIKLSILAIDELDLKSQKLTSAGWLSFEWEDDRINWTPSAKDDIEEIFSKPADIWKPELVVDNSFDDVGVISNSDLYLRVKSTGVVEWEPPMSFVTHCTVDITYYPYDKQLCSVNIISWGFTAQEVMLEPADTPVNLDDFETHGEWEILSSRAEKLNVTESTMDGGTIRVFPYVAFWLRLKRRSSFYNLNIVMPIFVTSLLVALTFIVPLESGEKLSYILTVFLALAVLLTLVADSLPSTSISTSVLGLYLGIVTVLAAFGILLTVLILMLYHKEGPSKKSPSGIMGITYFAAICTCSSKSLRNNKVTPINDKFESDDDERPESRTVYEADWKEIAVILDRFCFMMFSIITIVMNLSFVITLTAGGASYEPSE